MQVKMENPLTISTLVLLMNLAGFSEEGNIQPCDRQTFDMSIHGYCLPHFNWSMQTSDYQHRCPWPTTKGAYNALKTCVEKVADVTWCPEPSLRDDIFLDVHQTFFFLCSRVEDPALHILLLFALPCMLTTLLLPFFCANLTTCSTKLPCSKSL